MKQITRTREEVYKLWITALRSGEYKQTKSALKSSTGFCCLGVLCDLAAKDGGEQWDDYNNYKKQTSFLPNLISSFMNLGIENESDLIYMNDSCSGFKAIAEHIEKAIMPKALGI